MTKGDTAPAWNTRRRRPSSQRPGPAETLSFNEAQRRRLNFEQRRLSYLREQIRVRGDLP